MFGAYAVYHEDKVLMILRKKEKSDPDTGVWLGIPDQFVQEIKNDFPILKDLTLFGSPPTAWQVLRESETDFEAAALEFCGLIKKQDERIGRIPKPKPIRKKSQIVPKKIKVKGNK